MRCAACPVPVDAPNPCLGLVHPPMCRYVADGVPGRAEQLVSLATGKTIPPAPVPPIIRPADRPSGLARELVVARFKEDLGWLDAIRAGDPTLHVTVYDMGADPVPGATRLPNAGREAAVWLNHIVANWGDLADWTYLVQGAPHCLDDLPTRLAIDYQDATSLTRHYLEHFPADDIKAQDRVEHVDGVEVRYGRADRHGGRTAAENAGWLASVWSRWFACPQPDPWWFGYAAEFAVPRHRIKDRPLMFWRHALAEVTRATIDSKRWASDTASAWAFELTWAYLFADPADYPHREPPVEMRLAALADLCPHGSGPCGCGGEPRHCSRADRPDRVWRGQCIECQAELARG